MKNMTTIYFLIADIQKRSFSLKLFLKNALRGRVIHYLRKSLFVKHLPVGGIKVIQQHCSILNKLGFQAQLIYMGSYRGDFFNIKTESVRIAEIGYSLRPTDIIVCPEFCPHLGLQFINAKRVLFFQNLRSIGDHLQETSTGNYQELGYDFVFCCSSLIQKRLRKYCNNPTKIQNGIDLELFKPNPILRRPFRVLVMPRKHPDDIRKIVNSPSLSKLFKFVAVDGLSQEALILEYQKSDIFLATGYPEGFGLPPLEAMACGCVVVGFSGGGGNEFMIDTKTALVSEDAACEQVVINLNILANNLELKESLRTKGTAMSKNYSLNRTALDVEMAYTDLVNSL